MRGWPNTPLHKKLIDDPKWIAEPKADGDRCLVVVTSEGIELWNRVGGKTRYTWLVKLRRELEEWGLPVGCVLDCELLHEPKPSQNLLVFDVPSAGGTLKHRRRILKKLFEGEEFKYIKLVPWMKKETAYERALARGYEGVVFKRKDSVYEWKREPGQTSSSWVKIKPARDWGR